MKSTRYPEQVLIASVLVLSGACYAATLNPVQLAADMRLQGPTAVVQTLDRSGRLDAVLTSIASGNTAWVGLAPELSKGTDAGASTGLGVALATALPKNPQAVLQVLDDGPVMRADIVCGVPFVEPTRRSVSAYLRRAIPAVTRVSPAKDFAQRRACLEALNRAKAAAAAL